MKAINSFEKRSGVRPKFDMGDIISDGNTNIIVLNITSTRDGAFYLTKNIIGNSSSLKYEYFDTNNYFKLVKKGTEKLQYYISNDGSLDPNIYKIAYGVNEYPEWFEKEYNSLKKI